LNPGLTVVTSGGPGVGKTLTANVLAEQHKKVLYEFSASKHESGAENLERDVDIVLILCNRWKAVLLMDEGDVYLARRDENHDHAAVVAVFLRHIERYSGLLIVTTNRWNIIDPAIKSRVTLPVKYPSMSDDHQVALWRGMLANMGHNGRLSDDEITKMAALQLWNGRQVRNPPLLLNPDGK
jgi:replication-associated recombination protein RarA